MSGKKKTQKSQKMSLSDFLADESSGSWADEMANLPSAPSKADLPVDNYSSPRSYGGDRFERDRDYDALPRGPARDRSVGSGGRFERQDRYTSPRADRYPPRAPAELPVHPPYTAHVANLSFESTEDDIADFFGNLKIINIRILRDREERSKGFGYVEFEDLDSLKAALALSGETLQNRTVRVNVADPPKERFERAPRQPDRTDVSSWRRETPLELPERRGPPRGGRGERNERGFMERRFDNSWSGGAFTRRDGNRDGPSERPRLNLKPRSAEPAKVDSVPQREAGSRPNPFGNAKPVDTANALKKIEEKLSKQKLGDPEKK